MSTSKITSKYQATIPQDIRKKLRIKAGDLVSFEITDNDTVVVKKATKLDKDYLRALNHTLSEWQSEKDEEAYEDLQTIWTSLLSHSHLSISLQQKIVLQLYFLMKLLLISHRSTMFWQ